MDTHELPEDLNPSGDVCYPIFIPDDPHWRQLVIGALWQLTQAEYYRQNAFAPNDVLGVCDLWRIRTVVPFVQAMADETGCTTMAQYHLAVRSSTQAISANTDTKIVFSVGAESPENFNVLVPATGICTVSAKVALLSAAADAKRARILYNDANIAELYFSSTGLSQVFSISQVLEVSEGGYFSLEVWGAGAMTAQVEPFIPTITMVVQ